MTSEEVIELFVKSLVNYPDEVKIARSVDELGVLISVTVNELDAAIIIGKGGSMAQALRTIAKSLGRKYRERLSLKITNFRLTEGLEHS